MQALNISKRTPHRVRAVRLNRYEVPSDTIVEHQQCFNGGSYRHNFFSRAPAKN